MMDRKLVYGGLAVALGWWLGFRASHDHGTVGAEEPASHVSDFAFIDMERVFKEHHGFASKAKDLKLEVARTGEEHKALLANLQGLKKKLESLAEGSDDYVRLENEAIEKAAEAETFKKREEKRIKRAQTAILLATYNGIVAIVQQYADAHRIRAVFRTYAGRQDEPDPEKAVNSLISRPVVYERGLDITDDILRLVN